MRTELRSVLGFETISASAAVKAAAFVFRLSVAWRALRISHTLEFFRAATLPVSADLARRYRQLQCLPQRLWL
jgi:hypothetical protein